ncbi:acyl-CoA N-acyltransferase [Mycena galericulata]|nr:acyl-CoA N-acyltransferase [Mycena galericulata]
MDDVNANFCFPVPQVLENARVKLVTFSTSVHADAFCAGANDALFTYLLSGPFATTQAFIYSVETRVKPDPGRVLFAVIDVESGEFAGTIGLINTDAANLCTEVGFIITLPRFQRTHVTSNAAGLLLRWVLDAPAAGGLGLRRVAWMANTQNVGSVRAAERLGFRREGVLRWDRVLPEWKAAAGNGGTIRGGDSKPNCVGADSVVLGLCWDDWEGGAREAVDAIMRRSG